MDTTTLAFIFLGIAILLLPVALRGEQRSTEAYEEQIRALRQIIANDIENEQATQHASLGEVVIGVMIGTLFAAALIVLHVIPTAAMAR